MAAIAYYFAAKRRNLVTPMLTGDKRLVAPAPHTVDNRRSRMLALIIWLVCAGVVSWVWSLGG